MKTRYFQVAILLLLSIFSGCATRSISNSGYSEDTGYYGHYRGNSSQYSGELDELSVLGVDTDADISEKDIKNAIAGSGNFSLKKGDSVILIQSGAQFPDKPMTEKMDQYFNVTPLSGIPENPYRPGENKDTYKKKPLLNKVLRLVAARSNVRTIIVYWGILESAQANIATKTVSWVPIAGSIIPDENQQMRISVKGAVIDVASGNWLMLRSKSFDDKRISARINRGNSDQQQVSALKEKAYADLVEALIKHFSL